MYIVYDDDATALLHEAGWYYCTPAVIFYSIYYSAHSKTLKQDE